MHAEIFNSLLLIIRDFIVALSDFEFYPGITLLDVLVIAPVVALLLVNFVKGGH